MDEDEDGDGQEVYKLELETPLESVLTGLMWGALAIGVGCFLVGKQGGRHSPPDPHLVSGSFVLFALAAIAAALRRSTDCFYLLMPGEGRIDYHFQCLGVQHVRPYLERREIELVTIECAYRQTKHDSWHEYHVTVIGKDGSRHPMSDPVRDLSGVLIAQDTGARMAAALGVPFVSSGQEEFLEVEVDRGRVSVHHVPGSELGLLDTRRGLRLVQVLVVVLVMGLLGLALSVVQH